MPFYKDQENKLHFLSDEDVANGGSLLLPVGCIEINNDEAVVLRKPSADQSRSDKWGEIKAERDRRKAGGVKVGSQWYHTDSESRIQHLGLKDQARDLMAAGLPDTTRLQKIGQDVRWKMMDGSFVYLTVQHAFSIVAAVGDLDALAFTAAETHRVAMEASDDPASYDFSAGWPAIYEKL